MHVACVRAQLQLEFESWIKALMKYSLTRPEYLPPYVQVYLIIVCASITLVDAVPAHRLLHYSSGLPVLRTFEICVSLSATRRVIASKYITSLYLHCSGEA